MCSSSKAKSAAVEAHLHALRQENGITGAPFVIQDKRLRRAFNTKLYDEWWPTDGVAQKPNAWDSLPNDAEIVMIRA